MLDHEDIEALSGMWQRWDADPSNPFRAEMMSDVVEVIGRDIGISAVKVRERLAALRREGVGHTDAIVAVVNELSSDKRQRAH